MSASRPQAPRAVMSDAAPPPASVLDALAEPDRARLLARGRRRRFAAGETLFGRGDPGGWLLLIERGTVEISLTSAKGRRSILGLAQPGEILGEISLLDRRPRSADAVARVAVDGTVVHAETLRAFLRTHPECALAIIETLCRRVRNASDRFETQALTSAAARLARTLLSMADRWGRPLGDGRVRIEQAFSQSDLGDFAGIARENVNRHLRAWTGEGLVELDDGLVTLCDRAQLEFLAEL